MAKIRITRDMALEETEISEEFIRASGPGGQNVNKVASAVKLRFDVSGSASLPEDVRRRLISQAKGKMTKDGFLIIHARRFRTQERNRRDALERLVELIRRAAEPPKVRRPTRPPAKAGQRRVENKRRHGRTKRLRGVKAGDEQ